LVFPDSAKLHPGYGSLIKPEIATWGIFALILRLYAGNKWHEKIAPSTPIRDVGCQAVKVIKTTPPRRVRYAHVKSPISPPLKFIYKYLTGINHKPAPKVRGHTTRNTRNARNSPAIHFA